MSIYENLKLWFDVGQAALTALVWVYVAVATRRRATRAQHQALEERLARAEAELEHKPGLTDLEKIYDKLNPLHSDLEGVKAALQGVNVHLQSLNGSVTMLNEYLLREKR